MNPTTTTSIDNTINTTTLEFTVAKKRINSPETLQLFLKGKTFAKLMDFLVAMQFSVEGKNKSASPEPNDTHPCLYGLMEVLTALEELVTETKPYEEPQRYGNKAFKEWYAKVEENYETYIKKIINIEKHPGLDSELKSYFLDCFGSSKRLDFGTGHELNFLCILLILFETGYYTQDEFEIAVNHVFFKYLLLVRNLQVTYRLEPAGAHGVWGLDEYHFIPFIFGACQLIKHPDILPSSIHSDKVLDTYENEYMYLSCIKYIKSVKSGGSFGDYAPMLDTISNVPLWEKVAKGLVKMFVDEVLKKFVIMQHFYFGSVIKFE